MSTTDDLSSYSGLLSALRLVDTNRIQHCLPCFLNQFLDWYGKTFHLFRIHVARFRLWFYFARGRSLLPPCGWRRPTFGFPLPKVQQCKWAYIGLIWSRTFREQRAASRERSSKKLSILGQGATSQHTGESLFPSSRVNLRRD